MKPTNIKARVMAGKKGSVKLPDGKYDGQWEGYRVRFDVGDRGMEIDVDVGVSCREFMGFVACWVTVTGGMIEVEAKDPNYASK